MHTQTDSSLSQNTPRKKKLHILVNEQRQRINSLTKEVNLLKQKQSRDITVTEFTSACDTYLPTELGKFVKAQIAVAQRKTQGRRYQNEFKQFALSLYFVGPKVYRLLQKTFVLPSPSCLHRYIKGIQCTAGINESVLEILRIKCDQMQEQDKFCIICVDEMSIKSHLFYNYGKDEVIGFEDNGLTKTLQPACSACTFMVRGIHSNWKQPFAYVLANTNVPSLTIINLLDKFVERLTNIGLNVKGLVTDMGSNFIEMSNILNVTAEDPVFIVGNKTLFYFFDPPHLIKATRNNLMNNTISWNCGTANWSHIQDFYEQDKKLTHRTAPKLTDSHIKPTNFEKMRVRYATQVLSFTTAAGMEIYTQLGRLPKEAEHTIAFISMFDNLFDIFNSWELKCKKKFRCAFKGETYQLEFLEQTLQFLSEFKMTSVKNRDNTNYMKFIRCWEISINSLIKFWEQWKSEGFKYLYTRRLNQDCLENFFGAVRQQNGNCVNPTSVQFKSAFRKLCILNLFHTKNMNCAEDFDKLVTSIGNYNPSAIQNTVMPTQSEKGSLFSLEYCDYHEQVIPEQNAFKYVCGYLINKCLKIHSCDKCNEFASQNEELDESNLFVHFKAYDTTYNIFGKLKTPHELFYNYIYKMEQIIIDNLQNCINVKVGQSLLFFIDNSIPKLEHPCDNFPLLYLQKLYIRFRIYHILKRSNREFKTVPKKNRKINILMNL